MHAFNVELGTTTVTTGQWPGGTFMAKALDAQISSLFSHKAYAAAYAAYVMWPGTCTIFGVAVPIRDAPDAARAVRDRYVSEGFSHMVQIAKDRPQI